MLFKLDLDVLLLRADPIRFEEDLALDPVVFDLGLV